MNLKKIHQILKDTDFVHTGGTAEELRVAEYLKAQSEALGATARIEGFPVAMADVSAASLTADGRAVPCEGYRCCGSGSSGHNVYRSCPCLERSLRFLCQPPARMAPVLQEHCQEKG